MRERRTPGGLQMQFPFDMEPMFLHECREGIMCMTIESYGIAITQGPERGRLTILQTSIQDDLCI
jgi:hypothetical protein